jgi:hypothetical protein
MKSMHRLLATASTVVAVSGMFGAPVAQAVDLTTPPASTINPNRILLSKLNISDAEGQKACNSVQAIETVFKNLEFKIELKRLKIGPSSQPVTVWASTSDGTAIAGRDYVGRQNVQITFSPNENQKTFIVNVLHNTGPNSTGVDNMFVDITFDQAQLGFTPLQVDLEGEGTISCFAHFLRHF